jgi:hypothetical protein
MRFIPRPWTGHPEKVNSGKLTREIKILQPFRWPLKVSIDNIGKIGKMNWPVLGPKQQGGLRCGVMWGLLWDCHRCA